MAGGIGQFNTATSPGLLHRIALLAIAAPRRTIAVAAIVMAAAAIFGIPVAKSLSAGGFADPTS
jgi:putative drug exporter of the RND superfamily